MNTREGNIPVVGTLPSIYVVAHELKSPLLLVRQLALELQAAGTDNPQTVERLLLTTERSLRLVEQLTKTSRLEDAMFAMEPLHAQAVCHSVVEELGPLARAAGQELRTHVSRRSGIVVGHRSLLTALLVNLCDNALTYSPAGSQVTLSSQAKNSGDVVFSVHDTGPKMHRQTFELLRRQAGAGLLPVSGVARSTGLGLWIASRFAEAMNGSLTLTQHRTAGITVSVALPQSGQLTLL